MAGRKRSSGLLPGEYRRRSTVITSLPMEEGGSLMGNVSYVLNLHRLDGQWDLGVEWVDLNSEGHRARLPHQVVSRLLAMAESVMAEARSERGKKAAETARARGHVPFHKKGPGEE